MSEEKDIKEDIKLDADGEVMTEAEIKEEEEYNEAFSEGDKEDGKEADKTDKEEPEAAAAKEEKEEKVDDKTDNKEKVLTGVDKALHDTKVYATDLAEQLKTAKAQNEKYERGEVTAKEAEDAKDAFDLAKGEMDEKLKTLYEDYPELKDVLTPIVSAVQSQSTQLSKSSETNKIAEAGRKFEEEILPLVTKGDDEKGYVGHGDAKEMIQDPRYLTWATTVASPGMKNMALQSGDPSDVSSALTEFKRYIATPEGEALKGEQNKIKNKILQNSQTLRTSSTNTMSRTEKKDQDDYDAGWDEAGKELEGV